MAWISTATSLVKKHSHANLVDILDNIFLIFLTIYLCHQCHYCMWQPMPHVEHSLENQMQAMSKIGTIIK